jgi:hypothetical protein
MNPRRAGWIALAMALLFSVAPAARTSAKPVGPRMPFVLTPDTNAYAPALAVDAGGTGYFAWDSIPGTFNDPFHYCRIKRDATRCDVTKTFNFPHFAFGRPQVFLPAPGEVVLMTYRCCDGAGDLNDASSWPPARPLGPLTEPRLASGIKGAVLMAKQELTNPSRDVYVTRRWDPVTGSFGSATRISDPAVETSVTNRDIYQDAGGNITAVFESNRQNNNSQFPYPLEYRVSKDGGKTWLAEQTLVDTDQGVSRLAVATGPDGGGWVAWHDEHGLRAASIPPVSSQPGGGPNPNCPQTLQFGSVQAMAVAGCFEKVSRDVYAITDPVRVDGLDLYPHATGKITIDTVTGAITAAGVDAKAGNV